MKRRFDTRRGALASGHIFFLMLAILMSFSCSRRNPVFQAEGGSSVELEITFEQTGFRLGHPGLAKMSTITHVYLTVTGPGMSTVTESLIMDLENNIATGTVTVPKGNSRTFRVDGEDENGVTQFSGSTTQDINNDTETVELDVSWIPPDPVEVTFANITSTTADVSWTASDAPDFYFYRVLVSTSTQLDVGTDGFGEDIYDLNSTGVTLAGLSENTTYYVAVIAVDTELWYSGTLEYGNEYSIVETLTTAQVVQLGYGDGTFENSLRGLDEGSRLVVSFTCPSYPCFVETIWLYLLDESGQDGNYRMVITDSNLNDIFRTADPLETAAGETWVGWNPIWSNRAEGTVNTDFYAGIEYARTSENNWPFVGFDESSNSGRGYFVDSEGNWSQLGEFEFFGNLGIQAIVEVGGGGGQTLALMPDHLMASQPVEGESMAAYFHPADDTRSPRPVYPGDRDRALAPPSSTARDTVPMTGRLESIRRR